MLRGENIVCGTSTTGTGTLTLAATPVAPGGIDFDVLARATGIGFGNSAAILVSYTIIEYTDTTFATAKSTEKGIGTLTLGGSSGIANCTLARTTVQITATNLNSQPATYNTNAPTAVSIGTAANVLVFVGASAADVPAWLPYYENTFGDTLGAMAAYVGGSLGAGSTLVTARDYYIFFEWRVPMLVKRASMRVTTAYATGTPVSDAYARIYAINSAGRPGKLLIDFGRLGSAGVSLNSTGAISSAAHSTGFFLTPGEYVFNFLPIFSGATTIPQVQSFSGNTPGYVLSGRQSTNNGFGVVGARATAGLATAPDPAETTGYTANTDLALFTLKDS